MADSLILPTVYDGLNNFMIVVKLIRGCAIFSANQWATNRFFFQFFLAIV